jgi:hypothetical protein
MQLPFFLLLFLGLLYKHIWFVWFVKAVANAKKRPCFLGQGLLVTTTDITLCCDPNCFKHFYGCINRCAS